MEILRKYGEATTILFPLIDAGAQDFENTPVTFEAGDAQISGDEGTFVNTTNTPAHRGNGIYSLALTATEMEAARIVVTIIDQTSPKEWEDQAILIATYGSAAGQHAFDLDTATQDVNVASGGLTAASIATDAVAEIADGVWDEARSGHVGVGTFGEGVASVQGDVQGSVKGDVEGKIWGNVEGSVSLVNHLASTAKDEVGDAVWDEQKSEHVAAGSFGEEVQSHATPAEAADVVWDEAIVDHVLAGSFGEEVQSHATPTEVNAQCDQALADYDPPTKAELDTAEANIRGADNDTLKTLSDQIDALNDPTAAAIADQVWDEALADHLGTGSTGEALNNAGSGVSAADIADAVWDEAAADHIAAGSFGEEVQAHATPSEVNVQCDQALADYDPPTKAEMDAGFAGLNDPTAAAIADQVWDEAIADHVAAGSFGEEVQDKTGYELSASGRNDVADSILSRAISNVEASAPFRSLAGAIAKLVNRIRIDSGTLTVYKTDDATVFGSQAVTTDANAEPITALDTD